MMILCADPESPDRVVAMVQGQVRAVLPALDILPFAKRMQRAGMSCKWDAFAKATYEEAKRKFDEEIAALEALMQEPPLTAMFPFQREGARFLASRSKALLGDDMGAGKSVQTLAAIPEHGGALVVCPASARGVWFNETKRWRPDLEPIMLTSFQIPDAGELCITTYDRLPDTAPTESPQIVLIADEAHMIKGNPKRVRRARTFRLLAGAVRRAGGTVWGLTATPLLNTPIELWSVLDAFGLATTAYGSKSQFFRMFGAELEEKFAGRMFDGSPRMIKTWTFPDARSTPFTEEVGLALRRVMLRRMKKDVLPELPDKMFKRIPVQVTSSQVSSVERSLRDYERSSQELFYDHGGEGDAQENSSTLRKKIAELKFAAVLDQVEELEAIEEPCLVFSAHRFPIEQFEGRSGWEVIHAGVSPDKRTEIAARFQAGKLKGLALTIQSGGIALTLTRAAFVLFVDRCYTPALNQQAEDRALRIGQKRSVLIIDFDLDDPIEERVCEILSRKQATISMSVDAASNPVSKGAS